MKRSAWNTYRTTAYTFNVANDQPSSGGVHHHQVRKTRSGWQKRIIQSNGTYRASGPVVPVDDANGEAAYATAKGGAL